MRDEEIHVGDVLRVRRWEDMEAEYGLNDGGNIECDYRDGRGRVSFETFYRKKRHLCGSTLTIARVHRYDSFLNDYEAKEPRFEGVSIEAWMLEPITPTEDISPENPDDLLSFLLA